jgi:endonuclease IV
MTAQSKYTESSYFIDLTILTRHRHILPHGSYLVNLAQEDKAKAKQAYDAFLDDLRRCEALGITLYNFQLGSDHHHLNQSGRSLTIL